MTGEILTGAATVLEQIPEALSDNRLEQAQAIAGSLGAFSVLFVSMLMNYIAKPIVENYAKEVPAFVYPMVVMTICAAVVLVSVDWIDWRMYLLVVASLWIIVTMDYLQNEKSIKRNSN